MGVVAGGGIERRPLPILCLSLYNASLSTTLGSSSFLMFYSGNTQIQDQNFTISENVPARSKLCLQDSFRIVLLEVMPEAVFGLVL